MSRGYGFPVASKILSHQDKERTFQQHRQKVNEMNAGVDNSEPHRYPHLVVRLKQRQLEQEHQARIEHENKLLLNKMMQIMEKRGNNADNNNHYSSRGLNWPYKEEQLYKMQRENLEIARRLGQVKPFYNTRQWEDDHKRHLYYLQLWADSTKDYTPRTTKKKKVLEENGDGYESDFEAEDEQGKNKQTDHLPPIKNPKKSKHGNKKKHSESQTLPKLQGSKADERPKADQAEVDAKQLFRVAKVLAPPHDIFIRTLVRRTPGQRSQIKKKFKQLYDLDLAKELKSGLGKEWHTLVDALLPEKAGRGGGSGSDGEEENASRGNGSYSPEEAVHAALERGDIPSVVQLLASRTDAETGRLKESYTKEYSVSLDADIAEHTSDPVRLFLLTLAKKKKERGKNDSHQDALDLFEYGEGRWTSPHGLFLKLMEERSNSHVQEVLRRYEQVSGGVSAIQAIRQDSSDAYAKAVEALLSTRGGEGRAEGSGRGRGLGRERGQGRGRGRGDDATRSRSRSRDGSEGRGGTRTGGGDKGSGYPDDHLSASELATFLYRNLDPSSPTFVNTLVSRSESDMGIIRKAYKKKYGKNLEEELEERSRHPTVIILVKLILKAPSTQKGKGPQQDTSGRKREHKDVERTTQGNSPNHDHRGTQSDRHDVGQGQNQGEGRGQTKGDGLGPGQQKHQESKNKDTGNLRRKTVSSQHDTAKGKSRKSIEEGKDQKRKHTGEEETDSKADADAERLHRAMDGLGTNVDTILDILIGKSNVQRQAMKAKYEDKFKKELVEDLKSELGGDFEEIIAGLLMSPVEYDAHCLHSTVNSPGSSDGVLIGILCTASSKELSLVKEQYKKTSGENLDADLKKSTGSSFMEILLGLSEGHRDQGSAVTEKEARKDAATLHRNGQGPDINDEVFKTLLIKKNRAQVKATLDEYKKLTGKRLEDDIKAGSAGKAQDRYVALLAALEDHVTFFADSLHWALKEQNDSTVIMILISRCEVDLPAIKAKFQERTGRAVRAAIDSEIKGGYKRALIKLVDKK